jgi:hypothetical protein
MKKIHKYYQERVASLIEENRALKEKIESSSSNSQDKKKRLINSWTRYESTTYLSCNSWSKKLIDKRIFSKRCIAKKGSLLARLRGILANFKPLEAFIKNFIRKRYQNSKKISSKSFTN